MGLNLITVVRDILSEPTAARFSDEQIYTALQLGAYDVAWRLPDDSAMNLRRTKTQITIAGTSYYALPDDFMFEKGILSCTFKAVPCGIVSDLHLLQGFKVNSLMAPSLIDGAIVWISEQVVGDNKTWCINIDPTPEDEGPLIYIYRALPSPFAAEESSDLPSSCEGPMALYASMYLKGGRDDSDVTNLKGLYKEALVAIGANVEGL